MDKSQGQYFLRFLLALLYRFIFGEASIKEGTQRTTCRSSHDTLQVAFIQPNPFTASAAI